MDGLVHTSNFGRAWWAEICKKVKKSIVYIDESMCECLRWNGGVSLLFESGALAVKEFSLFESPPSKNMKKAVFLCSAAFHGTNMKILEKLVKGSSLEYCVLISTAHQTTHHLLRFGGREGNEVEVFGHIEEQVLQWMGNLNYTVEVFYYPAGTIHPAENVFLMPVFSQMLPLLDRDVSRINEQLLIYHKTDIAAVRSTSELTFSHLPLDLQAQVRHFVVNLNSLLQHVHAREDIFTVGDFSRIIGNELENLASAKTRRKGSAKKVSLVLVDRTVDLPAACDVFSANLFDKIFNVLSKFSNHSSDVAVPMSENSDSLTAALGCLAPANNEPDSLLEILLNRNGQEAFRVISQRLAEILKCPKDEMEKDPEKMLKELYGRLKADPTIVEEHSHLFQVAIASLRSLCAENDHLLKWQSKLAVYLNDTNAPSPVSEITQLVKSRQAAGLELDKLLVLLVHVYSLAGDSSSTAFSTETEGQLKLALAEAFVNEKELSPTLQEFIGDPVDEVKANRAAKRFLELLHSVSTARSHLKKYRHSIPNEGFLTRVVKDILDPAVGEIPDIEHRSGGLKDLLKTGFSLFVNVRKPKVCDSPTVIVFVVGGLRPGEVKILKDLAKEKSPQHEIIFGSSHFISRNDVLDFVLKKHL